MTISPPGSVDPPDLSDLGAEPPATGRRRISPARIAVVATSVFILGMWIFVYVWGAAQPTPDKLSTPAFALKAEPICKLTATQLAALPPAQDSSGNVARAEVVSQTNQDLRAMLSRLATVVPGGNDGRIVTEWLADYSTYVGNREDYARRLRSDPKARFYEAQKEPGEQISDPIDTLATANHMDDCVAPEDLS
jgi:hypothetical protein